MNTEKTNSSTSVHDVVMRNRYLCEKCGGIGQWRLVCCPDCDGVGYLGYVQVTKEEFYKAVGPVNCHPQPVGKYPYTSQFKTPSGIVVGAHVSVDDTYWLQESA